MIPALHSPTQMLYMRMYKVRVLSLFFTHSNDGWNLYTCLSVALNGWFTLDLNNVLTAVDFICTNMCVMVCILCSDSQTVHSTATPFEPRMVEMSNFDYLSTDIFYWGMQDLSMWLTPGTSNFWRHGCGPSTSHHGTGKESPRAPRSFICRFLSVMYIWTQGFPFG